MYRIILVATDGSELSSKAVKAALRLANNFNAQLVALNVQPPYQPAVAVEVPAAFLHNPEEIEAEARQQSEAILLDVAQQAQKLGVACQTETLFDVSIHQGVISTAKQCRADLIVMASHGRSGLKNLILGSETSKVLEHCQIPVLVHR
ncbi:MAG: universal stress protein [Burkholderiaceae bacterium]